MHGTVCRRSEERCHERIASALGRWVVNMSVSCFLVISRRLLLLFPGGRLATVERVQRPLEAVPVSLLLIFLLRLLHGVIHGPPLLLFLLLLI